MKKLEETHPINWAVKQYFLRNEISLQEITERLGYTNVQTVRNLLSTGVFGERVALKWAKEFGFNEKFLLTGEGKLTERLSGYQKLLKENEQLRAIVRIQKDIIDRMRTSA